MPTGRFYAFAGASFVFYLFANQTQIGWLYVISALLAGVIAAAFLLNRASITGLSGNRSISSDEAGIHEADRLEITLRLGSVRRVPLMHLHLQEVCPLAESEKRQHKLFVPVLPAYESLDYHYPVEVDRRGIYHFPPLEIMSRAPFGLFRRVGQVDVPTSVLVYPEVRHLKRFPMFDRQIAAQMVYPRAGLGSEVIGVRPYRSGDSPRHIHWRSTARTGTLISKEFAEETRPGVSLVLDRFYIGDMENKQNAFEWAIKCAVSIADYVLERRYPLYLVADETDLPTPAGVIAWDALLQYMARVQPVNVPTLPDVINRRGLQSFVVVIVPQLDEKAAEALLGLKHRGYSVMPVVMNNPSVPNISIMDVNSIAIDVGEDWVGQLSDEGKIGHKN